MQGRRFPFLAGHPFHVRTWTGLLTRPYPESNWCAARRRRASTGLSRRSEANQPPRFVGLRGSASDGAMYQVRMPTLQIALCPTAPASWCEITCAYSLPWPDQPLAFLYFTSAIFSK